MKELCLLPLVRLNNTTTQRRRRGVVRKLQAKKVAKKEKTRRDADEHLTEVNKGRKEKNPIRGEVMESNAIELAKLIDELGRGETETGKNEMKNMTV